MKDQVDTLCDMGIKAAYINSSLNNDVISNLFLNVKSGLYKILYVAPERLETDLFIDLLKNVKVSLIAVDEAHCVSHWGHDFRPSYMQISKVVNAIKERPTIAAFTATATIEVRQDIIKHLNLQAPYVLTTGFNRQNLYFEVIKPDNKFKYILDYLNKNKTSSGIIYCSTRKTVEAVTDKLNAKGFSVTKYHAGLNELERTTNQDDFIYERKQIMVATNAFGMGIDKSNIRFVIHYNMPKNIESYYQEAGRAGRDGINSDCLLLFNASDVVTNKLFLTNNGDSYSDNAYKKLNEMVHYCHTDKCLRNYILNYFGETDNVLDCGYCSNCNNQIELTDITLESQKIMSCIKRMNERFGANLVVDVLRGSHSKKVNELRFNELPTYGIMKDYPSDSIKEIISYLISEEYLQTKGNQYPTLALSQKSSDILLGKLKVSIKRVIDKTTTVKENKQFKSIDQVLFEQLRSLRRELSQEKGIAPFIIFSDASLQDMCKKLPTTDEELLTVSGVGEFKLSKYGRLFLEKIKQYVAENPKEDEDFKIRKNSQQSWVETHELYNQGLSLEEIANKRGFTTSTIEGHLIECLENGLTIDLERFVSPEHETQIIKVVKEIGTAKLKPIKEALPDQITYGAIKLTIYKHHLG